MPLVGGRMSETPSVAYTLIDIPTPKQTLVHVHPGAEELGRVYQPALAIQASPIAFAARSRRLRRAGVEMPRRRRPRTPIISPGRTSRARCRGNSSMAT